MQPNAPGGGGPETEGQRTQDSYYVWETAERDTRIRLKGKCDCVECSVRNAPGKAKHHVSCNICRTTTRKLKVQSGTYRIRRKGMKICGNNSMVRNP